MNLIILLFSLNPETFWVQDQGFYRFYHKEHFLLSLDSLGVQVYSFTKIGGFYDAVVKENLYFVATDSGLYRAGTDLSWTRPCSLLFVDLYYSPGNVYRMLGLTDKHLYISTNNFDSWRDVDYHSELNDSGFVSACLSPNNTSIQSLLRYYVANEKRIYTKRVPLYYHFSMLPFDTTMGKITGLCPSNIGNDSVFIATTNGVFLWSGPDSQFIELSISLPDKNILCFHVSHNTDSTIWVGTPTGVYYTNDMGANWYHSSISDSVTSITASYNDESIVYAGTHNGIFRSTDGGNTFTDITWNLPDIGAEPYMNNIIAISSILPDTIFLLNENGPFINYGGTSWGKTYLFEPLPENADTVFAWLKAHTPANLSMGIIDVLTDKLGELPDIDGDGKIKVLLLDIYDQEGWNSNWCYSYFNPVDHDTLDPHSNKCDVIYVDYPLLSNGENAQKNITYSITDLIHNGYDPDEEDFLKTMYEWYGWYLTGTGEGNFAGIYTGLTDLYNSKESFVFSLYLYEKFGSGFLKGLFQNPINGIPSIDSTLSDSGYALTFFDDLFPEFRSFCFLNELSLCSTTVNLRNIGSLPFTTGEPAPHKILGYKFGIRSSNDTILFNATLDVPARLRIVRCGSDSTYEDIDLGTHNEAKIYYSPSDSFIVFFPSLGNWGSQIKIDTLPPVLLPPTSLRILNPYADGMAELEWNKPPATKSSKYFMQYNIYRAESTSMVFNVIATVDSCHYIDNTVQNESTYYYYVTGLYSRGESPSTDTVVAHPTMYPPPAMVSGRLMNEKGYINFAPPEYRGKKQNHTYNIYRKRLNETEFTLIASNLQTTSYIDTLAGSDSCITYGVTCLYDTVESRMSKATLSEFHLPSSNDPGFVIHDAGILKTVVSNCGIFGDPNAGSTGNPSYDWPWYAGCYYLWEGRIWVGTKIGSNFYVSHAGYGEYEFSPDSPSWINANASKGDLDIVSSFIDYGTYYSNPHPLGIKIIQEAIGWDTDPLLRNAKLYEFYVIYNKSNGMAGLPDTLEDVYFAIIFDADVSSADPTNPHIDDLVHFDGWTGNAWDTLPHFPSPVDTLTIMRDTTLTGSDGVYDEATLFGDDPDETTIYGDTLLVWRNMAFMYDSDDPETPENDTGDNGLSPGYIFGGFIYAPPSGSDSIFIDAYGDTARIIRPATYGWWNWDEDPGTDEAKYRFMDGTSEYLYGFRQKPHPYDLGADEFDYRFYISMGPFTIADGETLRFVFGTGVGYGMDGGRDTVYSMGYVPGARQIYDALLAWYYGSTNSDPYHPEPPGPVFVEQNTLKDRDLAVLNSSILTGNSIPIYMEIARPGNVDIKLYDITGRCVLNKKYRVLNTGKITANSYGMKNGVYFISIKKDGKPLLLKKIILLK